MSQASATTRVAGRTRLAASSAAASTMHSGSSAIAPDAAFGSDPSDPAAHRFSRSAVAARASALGHRGLTSLRVVPTAIHETRGGMFAAFVLALLGGGLVMLLLLNTWMAQGSYQLAGLQKQAGALSDSRTALQSSLDAHEDPAALAVAAGQMGMVPATSMAFIRLSDGAIIGVANPAPAGAPLTVVVPPKGTVSAPAATATATPAAPSSDAPTAAASTAPVAPTAAATTPAATSAPPAATSAPAASTPPKPAATATAATSAPAAPTSAPAQTKPTR